MVPQQSDVDDATMRIEDPSRVVGSGYIQFPPQVPFQHNLIMQPPTIARVKQQVHNREPAQDRISSVAQTSASSKTTLRHEAVSITHHVVQDRQCEQPQVSEVILGASTNTESHKLSKSQAKRRRKKIRDAESGRSVL